MIKLSENTFYDPKTGLLYCRPISMVAIYSAHHKDGYLELNNIEEADRLWNWLNEEWQSQAMKGG